MINNSLHLKNHISLKKSHFKYSGNFKKNFSKIFLGLKDDFKKNKNLLSNFNKKFKFNFKPSNLKKFNTFKTIAIIGMGGSILGAEAIYNFFEDKIKKKIYFFNDLNENDILNFKKKEKLSKVLFIIISKSGNTLETKINTLSLNVIKKKAKNVIIISENTNNFLSNLAKKFNLFYIEHKNYIGGRYSVLSEVGIIPAYIMGINIFKLRSRLGDIFKDKNKFFLKESSILLSQLLKSKKKNNLIFLNYSPELGKFLFWLQQLIAESLGKKNLGFLPVISSAPKDHHSLLQLYLDGPKDKLFYIFNLEAKTRLKIKNSKKTLSIIKKAQRLALIKSLSKKNIAYREIRIKKKNEETLGKLFAYFMLETIIIGKLSKINPYNQPAVEQVKTFTKQFLT